MNDYPAMGMKDNIDLKSYYLMTTWYGCDILADFHCSSSGIHPELVVYIFAF